MTEQIPDWKGGIDPVQWATEFCIHYEIHQPAADGTSDPVSDDLKLMIDWFANMAEAARSVGRSEGWDEAQVEFDLTVEQRRRAQALHSARQVTTAGSDPMELVAIAAWIIDGEEPAPEPRTYDVYSDRGVIRRITDTELPEPDPEGRDGPDYDRAAGDEGR